MEKEKGICWKNRGTMGYTEKKRVKETQKTTKNRDGGDARSTERLKETEGDSGQDLSFPSFIV